MALPTSIGSTQSLGGLWLCTPGCGSTHAGMACQLGGDHAARLIHKTTGDAPYESHMPHDPPTVTTPPPRTHAREPAPKTDRPWIVHNVCRRRPLYYHMPSGPTGTPPTLTAPHNSHTPRHATPRTSPAASRARARVGRRACGRAQQGQRMRLRSLRVCMRSRSSRTRSSFWMHSMSASLPMHLSMAEACSSLRLARVRRHSRRVSSSQ